MSKNVKRLLPFGVLVLLIIVIYIANLHEIFNLSWLQQEHKQVKSLVNLHPVLSPLIFIAFYTLSVCFVIPDSTILTLLSGFIFPLPLAIVYSVISEALGSLIFYQIFVSVFKLPGLRIKHAMINRIDHQLKKHPSTYMLFLRISHVIPFWTTNVLAAYFKIRTWTFWWTTFLGVIPLTYILAEAGHSLSKKFEIDKQITISDIFTTQLKLALLILGLLMMAPILFKSLYKKRHKG